MCILMHEKKVIRVQGVLIEATVIGAYATINGTKWLVFETEGGVIYFREAGEFIKAERKPPTIDMSKSRV